MGYAVYDDRHNRGRFAGYGVPAMCDHPDCDKRIDRGLDYACAEEDWQEFCGLHFCEDHLSYRLVGEVDEDDDDGISGDFLLLCERCGEGEPPFDPKPDTYEWMSHMLTDPSWEQWRQENTELVEEKREILRNLIE